MQNNQIHYIHIAALDGTDLRILQLQNNLLDFSTTVDTESDYELGSPFQALNKLEKLNLRNNLIKSFLNDWNVMNTALIELDLSYNRIELFNFASILNIWSDKITVDLSHNEITTISAIKDFSNFNDSQSTWILNDNPLNCDCVIVHLASYLQNNTKQKNSNLKLITDHLKCAMPMQFMGKSPANVPLDGLICPLDKNDSKSQKNCPQGCNCFVRTIDNTAVFNCSNGNLTKIPHLPNIRNLRLQSYEIHIQNNYINTLSFINETGYESVTKIFARNNSIEYLHADNLPSNLMVLDLSMNRMQNITKDTLAKLSLMKTLKNVSLGENSWICECSTYEFIEFIQLNAMKIDDINNITCNNDIKTILLNINHLCPNVYLIIISLSFALGFIATILLLIIFYYKYKLEIMIWIFANCEFLWYFNGQRNNIMDNKKYDAVVLYSMNDAKLVEEQLAFELENGKNPLKLYLFNRDSNIGAFIPEEVKFTQFLII